MYIKGILFFKKMSLSSTYSNSTPASYSPSINNVSSNVSSVTLPLLNKVLVGVNVATMNVNNGFLDISINAFTGPNSSISITKPGMEQPLTFTGMVRKTIHLGLDPTNTLPFIGKQPITIILNAAPNETIIVKQLSYKSSKPMDYKKITFVFLAVYFVLNMFL